MDEFKYCRICLVTGVKLKMFSLDATSSDSFGVAYSNLTGIPTLDSDQHVCFECANQLHKYQEFKSKCLRAHDILSSLKLVSTQITQQTIQNVNRKLNKLESTFIITPIVLFCIKSHNDTYNISPQVNEVKRKEKTVKVDKEIKQEEGNMKMDEIIDVDLKEESLLDESKPEKGIMKMNKIIDVDLEEESLLDESKPENGYMKMNKIIDEDLEEESLLDESKPEKGIMKMNKIIDEDLEEESLLDESKPEKGIMKMNKIIDVDLEEESLLDESKPENGYMKMNKIIDIESNGKSLFNELQDDEYIIIVVGEDEVPESELSYPNNEPVNNNSDIIDTAVEDMPVRKVNKRGIIDTVVKSMPKRKRNKLKTVPEDKNSDINDNAVEDIPVRESKLKTEPKYNKSDIIYNAKEDIPIRELNKSDQETNTDIYIVKSEDDFSYEEALKTVTKTLEQFQKPAVGRSSINFSFFKDYATIKVLTPEDARKLILQRRDSRNYKNGIFKCDICYLGFGAVVPFENHMARHSAEYGAIECDICHLRFPSKLYLGKHRNSCHKRQFSCNLCRYICYSSSQARGHVNFHKGKKYPCNYCTNIFRQPNSLIMHRQKKHLNESTCESVCELCGSAFTSPKGLKLHKMRLHRQHKSEMLGPVCEECNIHFATEMAWKRHLVLSSKHTVLNGCEYCGDTFPCRKELRTHMRVHAFKEMNMCNTGNVPLTCLLCDKTVQNRLQYIKHMAAEHPQTKIAKKKVELERRFMCEICGKCFRLPCFLTYHQRQHTGERPFKCPDCDKTFSQSTALYLHITSSHRPRIKHTCEMCGRLYSSRSALEKHIKGHRGIRPHKCTICDRGFLHLCDLKMHIKYTHQKVPWPKRKNKRRNTKNRETGSDKINFENSA